MKNISGTHARNRNATPPRDRVALSPDENEMVGLRIVMLAIVCGSLLKEILQVRMIIKYFSMHNESPHEFACTVKIRKSGDLLKEVEYAREAMFSF